MSKLRFLEGLDFEIPKNAISPPDPHRKIKLFEADPLASAVAQPIVRSLRSAGYKVTEPEREGRNSVWFRCEMESDDAGVAITIKNRTAGSLIVSTFACQIKKRGRKELKPFIDPGWSAVSEATRRAIHKQFGHLPGFVWHGEERYDSARSGRV